MYLRPLPIKKTRRKLWLLFSLWITVMVTACVQPGEKIVTPTVKPESKPLSCFPEEVLDRHVHLLAGSLEKENLNESKRETAARLMKAYQALGEKGAAELTEKERRKALRDLLLEYEKLIVAFFQGDEERAASSDDPINRLARHRDEILNSYLSHDFKGVIQQCLKLKSDLGSDALTPEISLLFALALGEEGMLREAVGIGQGIVRELGAAPDYHDLQVRMAEWQWKLGEHENATMTYEKLLDVLDEKQASVRSLNRAFEEKQPDRVSGDGRVEEIPAEDGHIKALKSDQTENLFERVEHLLRENRFGEARELLVLKREEASTEPELESIDQAIKSLDRAEETYLEERIATISKQKENLSQVKRLLEEEKYEEVISGVDTLEFEEEKKDEIAKLKEQAVERLINQERNRAAKVFLAAKQASDSSLKEQYFRKCYEILEALIKQYPSSSLSEKIKSNMYSVEEELKKLGKTIEKQ